MMALIRDLAGQAPEFSGGQMTEQPSDVPRFVQIITRYKMLVGFVAALGLLGGIVFAALNPPRSAAEALVVFTPPSCQAGAVCGGPMFSPGYAEARVLEAYPKGVQIKPGAGDVLSIVAMGGNAAEAAATANAAARSFVAYAGLWRYMDEQPSARILQPATVATGTTEKKQMLDDGLLGALFGGLAGIIAALAADQNTIDPPVVPAGMDIGGGIRGAGAGLADDLRRQ
jgi:hypothetical protein